MVNYIKFLKDKTLYYSVSEEYITVGAADGEAEYLARADIDEGWGLVIQSSRISDAAQEGINKCLKDGGRLEPQDVAPLYLIQELFNTMREEWRGRTIEGYPSDARRMRCYARACKRAGLEIETYEEGGLRIDITF